MMRWSPMRRVSSIEPEGMTRACPMVPLIKRNTSPTQNQARASRRTRVPIGSLGSSAFLAGVLAFSSPTSLPLGFCFTSAFTFHRHRLFHRSVVRRVAVLCVWGVAVALADFELHEIRGIDAGITRRTELAFGVIHGLAQGGKRDVAERICAQELADFFGSVRGGDELFARGRVHAVITRRNRGRATDAYVNFAGAGFADHANDFAAGGAADDGVVDENDALAFNKAANGIEFQFHAEIPDGLRGFDERAADVVIANQAHAERNFRFERVADGSWHAGVRNGHDNVGVDRMLSREEAAEGFAAFVDAAAENNAVRAREIDMFENALLQGFFRREVDGLDARAGDAHHFAGLDFADVLSVEQV